MIESNKPDLKSLIDKWPSSMVAREKISEFTGGIISPGTLANLDCKGEGPPKIRIGRKIAYETKSFVEWLQRRR